MFSFRQCFFGKIEIKRYNKIDALDTLMEKKALDTSKSSLRVRELNKLALDVTEQDELIQSFSRLLCLLTGAKYSQVNIFDEDTQYTIAAEGADFPPLPKRSTFCTYTLDQESTLEIPDMRKDERVKGHFAVKGEPHVNFYYGTPLITQNQVAIGTICVIHDDHIKMDEAQQESMNLIAAQITEYLEMKNELIHTKKHVEEQRSTLHKVVHDLRGPITGILGSLSMVDSSRLKPELRDIMTVIGQSCNSLIEYVNDSLKRALYKDSETDFITSKVLQKKLRTLYELQARTKNIELNFESRLKKREHITTLSSGELINVMGNLLNNAIKFSPIGSEVTLSIDYADDQKQEYLLSVQDHGVGMSKPQLEVIRNLQPADPMEGTDREQGFGIGLSEAMRTLKNNGGSFEVESTEGEGTTFHIRFPRKH